MSHVCLSVSLSACLSDTHTHNCDPAGSLSGKSAMSLREKETLSTDIRSDSKLGRWGMNVQQQNHQAQWHLPG